MITQLDLKNFTRFSENTFEFSAGINVFIGKNSMGKTHLLKLMACCLKVLEENNSNGKEKLASRLTEKLLGYFQTRAIRTFGKAFGRA